MKVSKQVERRRIMAVHLPESLMSKRIQNLVGRFVDEDGELGFVFRSTRYGREALGLELEEPRLRSLVAWLAEKQETVLLIRESFMIQGFSNIPAHLPRLCGLLQN